MITTSGNELKTQVKALAMLSYSMVFGLLLFATVSYFVFHQTMLIVNEEKGRNISFIIFVLAVLITGIANDKLRRKLNVLKENNQTPAERLKSYRTAYIIFLAVLEAVGLAGIICFLLTGGMMALVAPLVSVIVMFFNRPTEKMIVNLVG